MDSFERQSLVAAERDDYGFLMIEPIAYLNGRFIPQSQCALPMHDAGIVMGAAVTDLLRTYAGKPYAAEEHIDRFMQSARYAYLNLTLTSEDIASIVERLIGHNCEAWPQRELSLVFYATAGEFPVYAGAAGMAGDLQATVCLHCFPLPLELWRESIASGVHVITPAQRHLPPSVLSSKIKHRNRLHMWIGDRQAKLADPKAIGLFLDVNGNITETGGANFVIYRRGKIISPDRNNILWGVSLDTVRRISATVDCEFVERDLQIYDVVTAEEAWLCSTPYFLAPVIRINGLPIGTGSPGPVWRRITDAFSAEVGIDIVQQILETNLQN
jgi:branched-chain amino acid aminotransferase